MNRPSKILIELEINPKTKELKSWSFTDFTDLSITQEAAIFLEFANLFKKANKL